MSIYTRTGDSGMTSLYGGERLPKSDQIFEVLGSLDELNSWLGFIVSIANFTMEAKQEILKMQSDLFLLGFYLADKKNYPSINGGLVGVSKFQEFEAKTICLEKLIDDLEKNLPELRNFILPGVSKEASACHVARAVCRRAERNLVHLQYNNTNIDIGFACKYLNRMSDFLFQLSRMLNFTNGIDDVIWKM